MPWGTSDGFDIVEGDIGDIVEGVVVGDIVEGGAGDSCCLWLDLRAASLSPRGGKNSQKAPLEGGEKRLVDKTLRKAKKRP